MPTYTYRCKKCEEHFDVFHAISATPRPACPACGAKATERLLGAGAGVIFKGSGFYETDYKRDAGKTSGGSKSEGKDASKTGGKEPAKQDASSDKGDASASCASKSKGAGASKGSDSAA